MKPFSESCEQNKQPILSVLRHYLPQCTSVLEIGSGTGQHAVFFAEKFPRLIWHSSDLEENHAGIKAWISYSGLNNIQSPLVLDVKQNQWPKIKIDAVFSANTVHIMSWLSVEKMFSGVGRILNPAGVFILYGPFNYHGDYTSESNARFDSWLKNRDPLSGIRHFEALLKLAEANGMSLDHDYEMPVNNRILVWKKIADCA
jgi:cyclopropane fatty-acyl-phospholipid synthase-like methyltransferase